MGVVTFADTISSPVPAPKLFKALVLDSLHLLPKVEPQAIKSIDLLEGDGGAGSIRQVNFAEGVPVKYVKVKIDALDTDKMSYAETVIEGGELMANEKIESIKNEMKIESAPDGGGSVIKSTAEYHTKAGAEDVTEEERKPAREMTLGVLKALEAYLLANPDA